MPHRADRLRAGQETAGGHHHRETHAAPRAPRRDRPQSVDRLGRAAPGESSGAGARRRDAGARARRDEDRLSRVARMSDEEIQPEAASAQPADFSDEQRAPLQETDDDRDPAAYQLTLPSFHGP